MTTKYNPLILLKRIAVLVALIDIIIWCPLWQSSNLLQRKITVQLESADLYEALKVIAVEEKIPIGIEWVSTDNAETHNVKKISKSYNQESLESLLNDLMPRDSHYTWTATSQGVVNVFPKNESSRLLDVSISKIQFDKSDRNTTKRILYSLPELQQVLNRKELSPGYVITIKPLQKDDVFISLERQNVTVREILNEIGKNTGFWGVVTLNNRLFINF
jgi:hypothetical protein